jgi:hypothetical protein
LNDEHRAALAVMLESGPIPAMHGVVRWRVIDHCQCMWTSYHPARWNCGAVTPQPAGAMIDMR